MFNAINDFADGYLDDSDQAGEVVRTFKERVDSDPDLKAHRDWIEANHYGLGCRSFHWLWKMLVDDMPTPFRFLEVGVHCGQVTSLVGMLANHSGKRAEVVGVSFFTGQGIATPDKFIDYEPKVLKSWDMWVGNGASCLSLVRGNSTDPAVVERVRHLAPLYDVVYIDGGHDAATVRKDVANYSPMVRVGGYLVMDDSANNLKQPWGFFSGIQEVSDVVDEIFPPKGRSEGWRHVGAVMHLRTFQRTR